MLLPSTSHWQAVGYRNRTCDSSHHEDAEYISSTGFCGIAMCFFVCRDSLGPEEVTTMVRGGCAKLCLSVCLSLFPPSLCRTRPYWRKGCAYRHSSQYVRMYLPTEYYLV